MQGKGAYKLVLAIDCETTGLVSKSLNPAESLDGSEKYQAISWGAAVVDIDTFEVIDHYYSLVKPLEGFRWSAGAERIHGLSKEYLLAEGKAEEDAMIDLCEMIVKYWGSDTPIVVLGQNVMFDKFFLDAAMRRHGLVLRFSNRMIDTNTLCNAVLGVSSLDDGLNAIGYGQRTDAHNALDDALMAVLIAKHIKDEWNARK